MVEMNDEIARRLEASALVGVDIHLRAPIGRLLDVHDIAVVEIAAFVVGGEVVCRRHGDSRNARRGSRRK